MRATYWLSFGCAGAVLAAATSLGGCMDLGARWQKPGVTQAQRDHDYAACRAQSRDSSEAGEAADIEASENGQSHQPGVLPETTLNRGAAMESADALGECMAEQGYRYQ